MTSSFWMRLSFCTALDALDPKVAQSRNGHLFLVADPTQGFLGRGASWKSLGLEARGHTHNLRRSYRTTREIMQFATLLYRLRLAEERMTISSSRICSICPMEPSLKSSASPARRMRSPALPTKWRPGETGFSEKAPAFASQ